ncbi:hypothetical protein FKP32DRAFT_1595532 [Trametes sanguinea]|nr:hypothetical protein FKP32DRAFT_1595532 [Trametes sanguinea]
MPWDLYQKSAVSERPPPDSAYDQEAIRKIIEPPRGGYGSFVSVERFKLIKRTIGEGGAVMAMVDFRPIWIHWLKDVRVRGASSSFRTSSVKIPREPEQLLPRLYQDCLLYLRVMLTADKLACPVPFDLREAYSAFPSCFSTLAAFLADHLPTLSRRDPLNTSVSIRITISDVAMSVLDSAPCASSSLVLAALNRMNHYPSGQKLTSRHPHCDSHNLLCPLLEELRSYATEEERYDALCLACITYGWRKEANRRRRRQASPMPWSNASRNELFHPGRVIFHDLTKWGARPAIPELRDEAGRLTHIVDELRVGGCYVDIPWLGGQHDGFPVCFTLSSYVAVRRPFGAVRSLGEDAAVWLSAMTFGLLEAITRRRIPLVTLLDRGSRGEMVVSGARITRVLAMWQGMYLKNSDEIEGHQEHGRAVAELLRNAVHTLEQEMPDDSGSILICSRIASSAQCVADAYWGIILMVIILSVTLTGPYTGWKKEDVPELFELAGFIEGRMEHLMMNQLLISSWWWSKMRAAGWCPYTLSGLTTDLSSFLSFPRLLQLSPLIRTAVDEHAPCRSHSCTFYTFDETHVYCQAHTTSCCSCQFAKPPLDDVLRLLSQDVVPVILYDGEFLQVVPAADTPYVAISHVWAEGMGSATEDGLPTCVIERLASIVRQVLPGSKAAFWIDSLCVPRATEPRQRALRSMAGTYRNAAKVLVIDRCIRTLCNKEQAWEDNLLRIATSAWVRRVWTLQEGLLARELWFEFADGPCRMDDIEEGLLRQSFSGSRFLGPLFIARRSLFADPPSTKPSIINIVNLMHGRTTSKPEDELIAISGLVATSVDVDVLLAIKDDPDIAGRRMKSFLIQMRHLPLNVPFCTSPRLKLPHFTWAPRSLELESADKWVSGLGRFRMNDGVCTEDGFLGNYLLAHFETPLVLSNRWEVVVIRLRAPGSNTMCRLYLAQCDRQPDSIDALLFRDWAVSPAQVDIAETFTCVAVQLEETPSAGGGEQPSSSMPLNYLGACGMVKLESPEDDLQVDDTPGGHESPREVFLSELRETWVTLK